MSKCESFVHNDAEFLRHLPDHVESKATHTNIAARLGIEALCYWIENCRNNIGEHDTIFDRSYGPCVKEQYFYVQ